MYKLTDLLTGSRVFELRIIGIFHVDALLIKRAACTLLGAKQVTTARRVK